MSFQSGIFKHERVHFAKVGNRLLRDGVKFDSSDFNLPPEKYITLSDGSLVHFTEIVVQAVNREFIKCGNHVEAIRRGLEGLSLEVVFAFIFRDDFNALKRNSTGKRNTVLPKFLNELGIQLQFRESGCFHFGNLHSDNHPRKHRVLLKYIFEKIRIYTAVNLKRILDFCIISMYLTLW